MSGEKRGKYNNVNVATKAMDDVDFAAHRHVHHHRRTLSARPPVEGEIICAGGRLADMESSRRAAGKLGEFMVSLRCCCDSSVF